MNTSLIKPTVLKHLISLYEKEIAIKEAKILEDKQAVIELKSTLAKIENVNPEKQDVEITPNGNVFDIVKDFIKESAGLFTTRDIVDFINKSDSDLKNSKNLTSLVSTALWNIITRDETGPYKSASIKGKRGNYYGKIEFFNADGTPKNEFIK